MYPIDSNNNNKLFSDQTAIIFNYVMNSNLARRFAHQPYHPNPSFAAHHHPQIIPVNVLNNGARKVDDTAENNNFGSPSSKLQQFVADYYTSRRPSSFVPSPSSDFTSSRLDSHFLDKYLDLYESNHRLEPMVIPVEDTYSKFDRLLEINGTQLIAPHLQNEPVSSSPPTTVSPPSKEEDNVLQKSSSYLSISLAEPPKNSVQLLHTVLCQECQNKKSLQNTSSVLSSLHTLSESRIPRYSR